MSEYGKLVASDTLRIERILPGPIERVWEFLVDGEKRRQWLAGGAIEPRVGGHVQHDFDNSTLSEHGDVPPEKYRRHACASSLHGEVLEYEPLRVLAYTWGEQSRVRFELSEQGDDVRLVLTHERLPDRDQTLSVSAGWHTHLGILRDVLTGRPASSFWRTHTKLEREYAARL
jgi:uncharacterized protein YndB with AHSA1/START domain